MGLFYAVSIFTPLQRRYFLPWYVPLNARLCGAILSFVGQDIAVAGTSISSPVFSVRVGSECDGIEPIALFVCAVLAFPASLLRKIPGIICGTLLLVILNFVRIVILFLTGVYFPKAFTVMHLDVCQALFIFAAVLLWILWILWTTQKQQPTEHVSG